jgi:hypothetical protein
MNKSYLPVAVIGAGPVGLAAAAHLMARGLPVKVYEAGATAGANVRSWGHVRLFSPWRYNIDPAAAALLTKHGWKAPAANFLPSGAELYESYLKPLAAVPEMAAAIETGAKVAAISRAATDKSLSRERGSKPFVLSVVTAGGRRRDLARAVIDASGTWANPNPLGADGLPADGEAEHREQIAYGIPDVLGRDRADYVGKTVLVVGAGHSAANVLLDLAQLASQPNGTSLIWAVRGAGPLRVYGGGRADQLAARGELGENVRRLVENHRVATVTNFAITEVRSSAGRFLVMGETPQGVRQIGPVDRIIVTTGQRPDLAMTRELRLDLDPWLESAKALGPLIDPNLHSCGTVPPHGHRELGHTEPGFYTIGVKSYGRAPTFLMLTGYEQARSVAAAIAGDMAAADSVQLVLPETGVCSTKVPSAGKSEQGCCGGPAPAESDACCVADAEAKAAGSSGCGCGSTSKEPAKERQLEHIG